MRPRIFLFALLPLLVACAAPRRATTPDFFQKLKTEIETDSTLSRAFTGIAVADAETGKILCQSNADKLFIPASNTKILTLYACLKTLGDSIPALRYIPVPEEDGDTWPLFYHVVSTGDPTFLHPKFATWQRGIEFLKNHGCVLWRGRLQEEPRLGSGWMWDDYNESYSAEKSEWPVFGNCVQLTKLPEGWSVQPAHFQQFLKKKNDYNEHDHAVVRAEFSDTIWLPYYDDANIAAGTELTLPQFRPSNHWLPILRETFQPIEFSGWAHDTAFNWQTLYSAPTDTVLRRMMVESDNFIAEQLLIVCSGLRSDTMNSQKTIRWALDSCLAGLPQRPRWVDGSGLSRYNLNSPSNFVEILRRLWHELPHERLFRLFPTGGRDGTLATWFGPAAGEKAYVFAKTGSVSGVFCLSGYLVARSGRVLTFSIMHQNFTGTNRPWKVATQRILEEIRDAN